MLMEEFFKDKEINLYDSSLIITAFSYWTFNWPLPGTLAFYDVQRTTDPVVFYSTGKRWYSIAVSKELKDKLWEIAGGKGNIDKYDPQPISLVAQSFPLLNYDDDRVYALKIGQQPKRRGLLDSLFRKKKTFQDELDSRQKQIDGLLAKAVNKCSKDFGHNPHLLKWEKIMGKPPENYTAKTERRKVPANYGGPADSFAGL